MPLMPPTFRSKSAGSKAAIDRDRGTSRRRGYDSRWDRLSASYKRIHPLCLGCQAVGRVAQTEVTDHIVPHDGNPSLLWDQANWQPACKWHHDRIKQQLEALWRRGSIKASDLRLDSEIAKKLTHAAPGG
jgi:5-methylcytosine-specific restriction protein A